MPQNLHVLSAGASPLPTPVSSTASRRPKRTVLQSAGSGVLIAAALLATSGASQAQTPRLAAVFTQMDAASKRFQSATADVQRENYERVVRETTVQKGTIYIDRTKGGMEFGATVADVDPGGNAAGTPSRIVTYAGGTLQMYTPAEHQVDVFKSGANQGKLEGYFALGFGGTSRDLLQSWNITDAGPETLSDGGQQIKTEKLVLVSKDPAAQGTFKQITLWLDPARDVSLKQLFETPSGDHQTAIYSAIKLNAKPNKAAYRIPTGKGTTVVTH